MHGSYLVVDLLPSGRHGRDGTANKPWRSATALSGASEGFTDFNPGVNYCRRAHTQTHTIPSLIDEIDFWCWGDTLLPADVYRS